jgi:hypothetical protein
MESTRPSLLPDWLVKVAAFDVRGLSFLRIGLGGLLLWEWLAHWSVLRVMFTDEGILPRAARMQLAYDYNEPWWLSLQMLSGSPAWQYILAAIAIIAAGMVLLGYRTKPALAVSYVLLLGLQGRFPLLTQGGDELLRIMLFWALFVPLDQRWSWSAPQAELPARGNVASLGTLALIVQLCCMYWFTALLKTSPQWRSEFTAAYYALGHGQFTSHFGMWMMQFPNILGLATMSSWLLEWLAPFALFVPLGLNGTRWIVPILMIGFHAGLGLCLTLGNFPFICAVLWFSLMPTAVWDMIERWISRSPSRISTGGVENFTRIGSKATNAIVAFLLLYVVWMNMLRLENPTAKVGAFPLSHLGKVLGLDQYWTMFAPRVAPFGSWLRLEGDQVDGSVVNLYQPGQPFAEELPYAEGTTYPNQYWRRCVVTMFEAFDPAHHEGFARYFAKQWNASHPEEEQIFRARVILMIQATPPPGSPVPSPPHVERKELLELNL